jgi:hypothetical protein
MAINFNNQNRGIGALDLSEYGLMQPQNQNMQVAGGYDTPTEGQYGFNLIELDRLKNAGYDPAEVSTYPNKEDVQSLIRSLEPTSMAISNYDQLFGPRTMTDANQSLYTGMMDAKSGVPVGITDRGRPTMADIAGESLPFNIENLGNPTNDPRVVSEELGMTGFGRPTMADIAGMDLPEINENFIDRGNPFNDSRVVSEEQSLVGGIPDRGRGMPGAPTGAYEMIGGTPVAVGDVLGMQQALEKADFYEEPTTKRNLFNDLLGLASLAYTGPYQGVVKGANLFNNIRTGKVGKIASGIGSLGSKFAGKIKGINPITGRPNTQSQYEQARADRKQQSRVDYVADRLAKGKKTLSDPYSIAKNEAQRKQIRDGRIKGAEKKAAKDPYSGYGSCFIAGTKVSMADGTFKNIEYVKVGDKVKGHKEDNTVIKLDPTSLGDRKLYSFNNNQHYFFTSEHPFMTEEGWKSIKPEKTKERDGVELYDQLRGELKVGDKLVTDNGLVEITNIDSKEMNSPEMSLYNFNVSNDNSYIADGYIVHNKGGGGGKIVCTMMNERYGFGSFRNKIWMKFHEHHGPEYQKGYHAIFLPLVKIAKGEGKINTAVRKVLEHMGRHVTADMFKIMKGKKRDPLGRIYRAIFEPACHIIGKIKSALGRG